MYQDVNSLLNERCAGVLLHITSLPGDSYHGYLGEAAFKFVDEIHDMGMRIWQILPIGPIKYELSPYQSYSAHAGNIGFIDLDYLAKREWLSQKDIQHHSDKRTILKVAYDNFIEKKEHTAYEKFDQFIYNNRYWLYDYAIYEIIHQQQEQKPWWQWPEKLRNRDTQTLDEIREDKHAIQFVYFQQFLFFQQWQDLKLYANKKQVLLFGDIPIYVAHDSVDVWKNPHYFMLDKQGEKRFVAGVPPDYFSAKGQRWDNPLYDWHALERDDFVWWCERIKSQLHLFDLLRIDHFRAFAAYWKIPAHTEHATEGYWESAPGEKLFNCFKQRFGKLPFVAEDLGYITEDVHQLKQDFDIPGMAVAQFGFDQNPGNPHAPHNYLHKTVAYSGTHDNDTLCGWFNSLDDHARAYLHDYVGTGDYDQTHINIIKMLLVSPAGITILPFQDILKTDSSTRMNTPGTVGEENWTWQFDWDEIDHKHLNQVQTMLKMYNRNHYA